MNTFVFDCIDGWFPFSSEKRGIETIFGKLDDERKRMKRKGVKSNKIDCILFNKVKYKREMTN